MSEAGRKDDRGKLMWSLLPLEPVREVVSVLQWAAFDKKPKPYGPNNWQGVPNARERYYNAAQRHLTDWWDWYRAGKRGKDVTDHESGFHVLAHVGCCILFLLWFELMGIEDKPEPEPTPEQKPIPDTPKLKAYTCFGCQQRLLAREDTTEMRCTKCGTHLHLQR